MWCLSAPLRTRSPRVWCSIQPAEPSIGPRPATLARADALLASHGISAPVASAISRTVGFAPGAAYGHAKRWPPQLVAQTIVRLSREAGARCVLFGAGGDRDSGREIESSLPSDVRIVNLIGRTDLRLLVGAISRCAAFVSNDSGAMHLAGAVGTPLAALFGPTREKETAPLMRHGGRSEVLINHVWCRPCMLRECPFEHQCMTGLKPERVFESVRVLMGTPS